MKIILQISCLFLLLSSCENTPLMQQNNTEISREDSLLLVEKQIDDTRLNILNSQQISNTDVYIYPIGSALKKNSRSSYYGKKGNGYRVWNLIFYNLKTNKKRILFNDKVPIIQEYPNENDFQYMDKREIDYHKLKKTRKDKLFYKIIDTDFNKNGVIDYADPNSLFMSDLNGENFVKISPSDINLQTWKFMDSTKNVIEITGYRDSDNNLKFESNKDEQVVILLNLNDLQQKVDIFPSNFQNNLKELYIKNKKKK